MEKTVIAALEHYLNRISELTKHLQQHPNDYEVIGAIVFLQRAIEVESRPDDLIDKLVKM